MYKKLAFTALIVALVAGFIFFGKLLVKAATSVSFDPAVVAVNPGDSVTGDGSLMCGLIIGNSGENTVSYIQEGTQPSAYGANNSDVDLNSFQNGCLPKCFGIADLGDGSSAMSKTHLYDFSFSAGTTVNAFSISISDWGDYLPNVKGMAGRHEMILTAYDSANTVLDTASLVFDTDYNAKAVNRNSPQFGAMTRAGDACQATSGQPGNFTLTVNGSGIARVELRYADAQSYDPNIGISDITYVLEDGAVATRCAGTPVTSPVQNDMCANIEGVQTSVPNDYHIDASGRNCVQYQLGGAPQNSGSNSGQVLGTTTTKTGSVLGVSTLGSTGSLDDLMNIVFTLGAGSVAFGLRKSSLDK